MTKNCIIIKNMKYGIFGGAFDPPHKEHLSIAAAAVKQFGLHKIILLPESYAPHKDLTTSYEDRRAMLQVAVENNDIFVIDDLERDMAGVGYACVTLPKLKEKYGDILYIMGGDSMADFDKWKHPEQIIATAPIAVCVGERRKAEAQQKAEYYRSLGGDITFMQYQALDYSSSAARLQKRLGFDITPIVGQKVAEYIQKNKLYQEYDSYLTKLKAELPPDKFAHSRRTVLCAFELNKDKLSYDKVFTAALLHDCAKYSAGNYEVEQSAKSTPVEHAFAGAVKAFREYGVEDAEVLSAIYYHCTAKAEMSQLDKLIYCADMLESGRHFPKVEELRDIAKQDLDKGFLACLKSTYEHLKTSNAEIYPLSTEAYKYYFGKEKK